MTPEVSLHYTDSREAVHVAMCSGDGWKHRTDLVPRTGSSSFAQVESSLGSGRPRVPSVSELNVTWGGDLTCSSRVSPNSTSPRTLLRRQSTPFFYSPGSCQCITVSRRRLLSVETTTTTTTPPRPTPAPIVLTSLSGRTSSTPLVSGFCTGRPTLSTVTLTSHPNAPSLVDPLSYPTPTKS